MSIGQIIIIVFAIVVAILLVYTILISIIDAIKEHKKDKEDFNNYFIQEQEKELKNDKCNNTNNN